MKYVTQLNGEAYLVIRKGKYGAVVVDKATNKKPRSTPEGSVVVRVKLRMPSSVFDPIEPEAEIVVTDDHITRREPVLVEAAEA